MRVHFYWRTNCLSTALREVIMHMPRHVLSVVPRVCSGKYNIVKIYLAMMEILRPFLDAGRISFEWNRKTLKLVMATDFWCRTVAISLRVKTFLVRIQPSCETIMFKIPGEDGRYSKPAWLRGSNDKTRRRSENNRRKLCR